MEAKRISKILFDNKEFKDEKELKEYVHNIIGEEVIDKINRVCPPQQHKDLFKLLDVLCSPDVRKVLTKYLNITIEVGEEWNDTEDVNILDLC